MKAKNARFWIVGPDGSYVKLTLVPGQTLSFGFGGPTDEGYSCRWESYTLDAELGTVLSTITSEGRDCDGRMDRSSSFVCPVDQLRGGQECYEFPGNFMPAWERTGSHQRDYSAEAAGY